MTWWWWIDFSLIKVIGLFVWPTHHTTLYCYVVSSQVSSLVRDVATLFYSDSRKRERCLNKEIFETEIEFLSAQKFGQHRDHTAHGS